MLTAMSKRSAVDGPPRSLPAYFRRPNALSQTDLARLVGVTRSMISMLASGTRAARGKVATRIHHLTGVPIETLIISRRRRKKRAPPGRQSASAGLKADAANHPVTRDDADDDTDTDSHDDE